MYGVYHLYDVDGGFGDAVEQEELVGICDTEEEADDYVTAWDDPYVYEVPYRHLYCGCLIVKEIPGKLDIHVAPEIANPQAMMYYRRDHSNEVEEKEP